MGAAETQNSNKYTMQRTTIRLPDRLHTILNDRANLDHRTLSDEIRYHLCRSLGVPNFKDTEELDEGENPKLPLS